MTNSPNLDDQQVFKLVDSEDMLARIHEVPWQCEQAWQMALKFDLPREYSQVNKVIILGMGGSAIGGDLVRSLTLSETKIPVFVLRDYNLPAFIDAETLVIASSYSGNTEEVISSFQQALELEAKKLVITTGGKIKAMANERDIPVFSFSYRAQPRAALGFSFLSVLNFLQRLGFLGDKSADITEMLQVLRQLSQQINEDVVVTHNPAKRLAQRLHNRLPVVYGADILSEVAHRWKTQLNENSKTWAFYEIFPELNHNAVVGYQFPAELASKIMVVMLRSSLLPPRIRLRYQITSHLLEQAKVDYQSVDGIGSSSLSQIMSLVLFGDYVSYYLAILCQIDPSPVEVIAYLKEQLKDSSL